MRRSAPEKIFFFYLSKRENFDKLIVYLMVMVDDILYLGYGRWSRATKLRVVYIIITGRLGICTCDVKVRL